MKGRAASVSLPSSNGKDMAMKTIEYVPVGGVCTKSIRVTVKDGRIAEVVFTGGCHGNTQGVASLVRGMDAGEAVRRLKGIDCRGKGTSCPDQLARAIEMLAGK